jgi:hypothetical protein
MLEVDGDPDGLSGQRRHLGCGEHGDWFGRGVDVDPGGPAERHGAADRAADGNRVRRQ